MVLFETKRLCIQIPGEDLAKEVANFYQQNDALAQRWDPPLPPCYFDAYLVRDVLEKEAEGFDKGFETRFWLCLAEDMNTPIGYVTVQKVIRTDTQASCVIGYFLEKAKQGQGLMKEALSLLIDLLYEDYRMQRIAAYIALDNEPSLRLIESLGFCKEGITHSYAYIHNRWVDHACYAKIRPQNYAPLH